MVAIQGYYDGATVRPLERIDARANQRVIITIMDDFIEMPNVPIKSSMRGILAKYADPKLAKKEEGAWERAMVEKYGNA